LTIPYGEKPPGLSSIEHFQHLDDGAEELPAESGEEAGGAPPNRFPFPPFLEEDLIDFL